MKKRENLFYTIATFLLQLVNLLLFFLKIPGAVDFRAGFLEFHPSKITLYFYLVILLFLLGLSLRAIFLQGRVAAVAPRFLLLAAAVNLLYISYMILHHVEEQAIWFILLRLILGLTAGCLLFSLYPRTKLHKNRLLKVIAIGLCGVLALLPVSQLLPNRRSYAPVVYAVEDSYQIVWHTSGKSAAWVEIDGTRHYDSVGGAVRSSETIHKVVVPMAELDTAREYVVYSQKLFYRGAYFALKGKALSESFTFRPVDASDGLKVYHLADTHSNGKASAMAALYWEDGLDLLILNGDISSDVALEQDPLFVLELASKITRGQVPVLYARGNHETRGACTERFGRYVGCVNEGDYYYTTRLGNLWILVLDFGEDKEDGHVEYSGLADYGQYRAREAAFVERVAAEKAYEAPGITHRLLVSHIRVNNTQEVYGDLPARWTALANEMGIDLHLCGHAHDTIFMEAAPAGAEDDYPRDFPVVIGSKRVAGDEGENSELPQSGFIGTALQFKEDGIDVFFTSQKWERVGAAHHIPK